LTWHQLEVIELLGQGGMGMVYKARQPQLDRPLGRQLYQERFACDPLEGTPEPDHTTAAIIVEVFPERSQRDIRKRSRKTRHLQVA
jgi:hypothetical protein